MTGDPRPQMTQKEALRRLRAGIEEQNPRCPISELPKTSCYDCRHNTHGKRTPVEVVELVGMNEDPRRHLSGRNSIPVGTVVVAEWPGDCSECENNIVRGQRIIRTEDMTWVHQNHDPRGTTLRQT